MYGIYSILELDDDDASKICQKWFFSGTIDMIRVFEPSLDPQIIGKIDNLIHSADQLI